MKYFVSMKTQSGWKNNIAGFKTFDEAEAFANQLEIDNPDSILVCVHENQA